MCSFHLSAVPVVAKGTGFTDAGGAVPGVAAVRGDDPISNVGDPVDGVLFDSGYWTYGRQPQGRLHLRPVRLRWSCHCKYYLVRLTNIP